MMICRIEGSVHMTVKDPPLAGARLLLARPLALDGSASGPPLVSVDRADAGEGDLVLVLKEGGSARILLEDDETPVQCVVVAVIDGVELAAPWEDPWTPPA